ncbi:MAG: ferredoxin:thioredoxin reductase [Thermodesulfovibrionales bacterium]|nr:ferredoxin:thioredoxin reductase [Thermodesulfovibrionales bacterium]
MTPEKLYEILDKYAKSRGIELNKDKDFVLDILAGLLKNEERYGYRSCPCRLATGIQWKDSDIICPCKYAEPDIKEYGSCYCGLYVSKEWNEGSIKRVVVPERRKQT